MIGRHALTLSLTLAVTPLLPAHSQVPFLDKLAASITDLNAYAIFGSLSGDLAGVTAGPVASQEREGLRGFGFEVSFDVGGIGRGPGQEKPALAAEDSTCLARARDTGTEPHDSTASKEFLRLLRSACAPRKKADPFHTKSRKTLADSAGRTLSVTLVDTVGQSEEQDPPDPLINVEVALGFAQISAFRSQTSAPDFRGSLQEFPSFATYLTYVPANPLSIYGGVRAGLVKLDGLKAFELDTTIAPGEAPVPGQAPDSALRSRIYNGTGTTYLVGGAVGVQVDAGPLSLFVERAYTRRRFGSVDWSGASNEVIRSLPRGLKLDTWSWNIGAQARIKTN